MIGQQPFHFHYTKLHYRLQFGQRTLSLGQANSDGTVGELEHFFFYVALDISVESI